MHTFLRLLGFLRPYTRGAVASLVLAGLAMGATVAIPWLTGRGSEFSMCLRSKDDERYPKYPRVPVGSCPGYEGRSSTR